eukprot:maker-scaffold_12-augustus-gene-12.68-mRNA-1 protein AED:0.35 eAED:0.35 QI:0/0/0/1/0/0/2/0/956
MIVGQGRHGKSSLVRALLGEKFVPELDSTIGADLKKTDTSGWKPQDPQSANFNEAAARVFYNAQQERAKDYEEKAQTFNIAEDTVVETEKPEIGDREVAPRRNEPVVEANAGNGNQNGANQGQENRVQENGVAQREEVDVVTSIDNDQGNKYLLEEEDIARRFGNKLLGAAMASEGKEDPNKVTFSIWDMGGQQVFYTLHHLFLTKFGVYLLVFDLSEMINIEGEELKPNPEAIEYLLFWINSIMLHAADAPVFIVGTKLDKISYPNLDAYLKKCDDILLKSVQVERHAYLVKNQTIDSKLTFYPVSNLSGEGVESLRKEIEKVAIKEPYVEQEIPLRWVLLCDFLIEDELIKASWQDTDDVISWAKDFSCGEEEVIQVLKRFNELGVLIYLNQTAELKKRVITEPQWVIDKLGMLIRDDRHPIPDTIRPQDKKAWMKMRETGIISRALLEVIWGKDPSLDKFSRNKHFQHNVKAFMKLFKKKQAPKEQVKNKSARVDEEIDFLVDLMKDSLLISEWSYASNNKKSKDKYYLIPSLLRDSYIENPILEEKVKAAEESATNGKFTKMFLDFSGFFLPTGLFQRVICIVANLMAASGFDSSLQEPMLGKDFAFLEFIYSDCTSQVFFSAQSDKITIELQEEKIAPRVLKMVISLINKLKTEAMGDQLKLNYVLTGTSGKTKDLREVKRLETEKSPEFTEYAIWLEDEISEKISFPEEKSPKLKLYKYGVCPFCNKVKTFLKYNQIEIKEEVEVNPFTKKELKFSQYKKVPILMLDSEQLINSDDIIQYFLDSKDFNTRTKTTDESPKWRKFVDEELAPFLTINLYRSLPDAFKSFEYISSNSNFNLFERVLVKYGTPFFMTFLAKKGMMRKRGLKSDEEAFDSMLVSLNKWSQYIIDRKLDDDFEVLIEDLVVFGIFNVLDGNYKLWDELKELPNDKLLHKDEFWRWYDHMKKEVESA